jgi:drug/metabolite transporter (DMT)-like permease
MEKNILHGHIMALMCTVFWGTAYIGGKTLLGLGITPVQIILCRMGLAFVLLCLVTHKYLPLGGLAGLKRDRYLIIAAIMGTSLYYLLESIALSYTYATNISLIVTLSPMFSAWFNRYLPGAQRQKLGRRFFVAMAICLVGAALVIFNGNFILDLNPLGDVLGLLCAVAWAGYSFFLSRARANNAASEQPLPPLLFTRRIFFFGCLLLVLVYPLLGKGFNPVIFTTPQGLLPLCYLALFPTICGYTLWAQAMDRIGMIKSSVYLYFIPVVTIIASALLLNEHLTPISAVGAVLILFGLLLSQGLLTRKKPQEPETSN